VVAGWTREQELREAKLNALAQLRNCTGKFQAAREYWERRIEEIDEQLAALREEEA
jgi:hypothetical protein